MSADDDKDAIMDGVDPDEVHDQCPLMKIAKWKFELGLEDAVMDAKAKAKVQTELLEFIKTNAMTVYYEDLCKTVPSVKRDAQLVEEMTAANEKELKELDEKQAEAKKNAGDTEVREAKQAKADFFARIGDKEKALEAYKDTNTMVVGTGTRIDIVFSIIRLGLCWGDMELVTSKLEEAETLVEKGGDWERRNLLGIYKSLRFIMVREFKKAAEIMLSAVATFTCTDLMDYNTFVFYTVTTALVSVDRTTLRKKVIKAPEILSVLNEIPNLGDFLHSLYKCDYSLFFHSLATIDNQFRADRFLAPHLGYMLREVRIVAYRQFLTSYRSVTLASMAAAFGVGEDFLDKELARFIAAGRLNCKVDRVHNIVETNRPDAKNAQYQETIRKGDALLSRIQKLSKIISA